MFTTFLITMDLTSFDIELQGGQQYVVGVTQNNINFVTGSGAYRLIASHTTALTFEDLFQQDITPANKLPGFLDSQHGFGVEQHAGAVTLSNADYNGDHAINAADYVMWRDTLGASVALRGDGADGNGNGIIDAADYAYWRRTFGQTLTPPPMEATTVPEPSGLVLALIAAAWCVWRSRRKTPGPSSEIRPARRYPTYRCTTAANG
jgi:hypothetical protein